MKAYLTLPFALAIAATSTLALGDDDAAPWLGVATAPVDEVVAAHLDLPDGTGAAVQIVVPDSPADAAGIEKNDVLFEFKGEPVRSPEHLSELVRDCAPGDTVPLAVIHRGKKQELSATLGSRPDDLPSEEPAAGQFGFRLDPFGGDLDGDIADIEKRMEQMRAQMEKHFEGMLDLDQLDNLPGKFDFSTASSSTVVINDGHGSIEIKKNDGDTQVTAKDADGNIVFQGPANTEEERAKMPDDVRERFEKAGTPNIDLNFRGFDFGKPKMRLPELKPAEEVDEGAGSDAEADGHSEAEADAEASSGGDANSAPAIPPARKSGKKVQL